MSELNLYLIYFNYKFTSVLLMLASHGY